MVSESVLRSERIERGYSKQELYARCIRGAILSHDYDSIERCDAFLVDEEGGAKGGED